MRVLLTTDTVGGVWTFTRELTQQLLRQDHSVALVSFGRVPSREQQAWAEVAKGDHGDRFAFYPGNAPLEWMQNNHRAWAGGAELLTKVAETFQADILHSSQFCWGALPVALPRIITAHSDVRSWAAACDRNLPASPWLEGYDALVQDGLDGADAIVSPTRWMKEALQSHYEVAAPFRIIPNGRTSPEVAVEAERTLRAVTVGRLWDEGKGTAILSDVAPPMPIFLAGEACFEVPVSYALQSAVTALGPLDESSLFRLLSTSSIYLATSIYEPFGLAPLEAALCGCAVVARDTPTFREIWKDAALYFTNSNGLQGVLVELTNDQEKLRRLQLAAEQRARFFTAERMAAGYISLYRELKQDLSQTVSPVGEEMHAA